MEFVNDVAPALDQGIETHAIYTDFSKAFDLIDHDLLLQKIGRLGIHGSLLRWCESYLRNRTQLVALKGYYSSQKPILYGVPQGSHMGPLFFLIFINDLAYTINCNFQMYADDLKLYKAVSEAAHVHVLQSELNKVNDWCRANRMVLNCNKCFYIKFTRKKISMPATYILNGVTLKESKETRDLGIIMDSTLSYRPHFNKMINKANKLSGFISRQIKTLRDPKILIPVYYSLVRSLVEYCSQVWNPVYKIHSYRIEQVQKRFLFQLTYANNLCKVLNSYEKRLSHFNMSTLDARRRGADILFLYKLLNNKIDSPNI